MSKVTKAILMLNILDNKRKWKIKELSEKLEVSERMVRTYKNCLEEAGIKRTENRGSRADLCSAWSTGRTDAGARYQ